MSVIFLNKEKGISSYQALREVQKALNFKKAGHAGTLDPIATGLLPIFFDRSTKFIQYFSSEIKGYNATFNLGVSSDTQDIEGKLTVHKNEKHPSRDELNNSVKKFIGKYEQMAPSFSAKKVDGTPMYKLARAGKPTPQRSATVEIYNIELTEFKYPYFSLSVMCSKGTYIRTLGVDIAKKIECNCIMKDLERTSIGPWNLDDSVKFPIIKNLDNREKMQYVKRIEEILKDFPKVKIRSSEVKKFQNGSSIDAEINEKFKKHSVFFEEDFLGIGEFVEGRGLVPRTLYKV
ncbi:MAG: tRNA pseudouridine(55) synthase TruB [Gammaproteobacteria bacterium]|nr:tRNA pseudouridine(55) synthase TruB [Gammaproteobacteria bacterium]|tara:strand:+ start:2220 stop:3089 length:870 start_codon:yes stop_codon:yes gene_type:complete